MDETMHAYLAWMPATDRREQDFEGYLTDIAQARYVARRVFRLVDEEAKRAGLEPLQHQALLQIAGTADTPRQVNDVATLLDVSPAFASRLVRKLEEQGLITRSTSPQDRRVSCLRATAAGLELLRQIDRNVHLEVGYFQHQLAPEQRAAALRVFAFYVGATIRARRDGQLEFEDRPPDDPRPS